jgi:hypothetical protein
MFFRIGTRIEGGRILKKCPHEKIQKTKLVLLILLISNPLLNFQIGALFSPERDAQSFSLQIQKL